MNVSRKTDRLMPAVLRLATLLVIVYYSSCYDRTVNSRHLFRHEFRLTIEGQRELFNQQYKSQLRNGYKIISAHSKDNTSHVMMVVAINKNNLKLDYDDFIDRFKKQLYLKEFNLYYNDKSYYFKNKTRKFAGKIWHVRRQIFWEYTLKPEELENISGSSDLKEPLKVFFTTHLIEKEYPI